MGGDNNVTCDVYDDVNGRVDDDRNVVLTVVCCDGDDDDGDGDGDDDDNEMFIANSSTNNVNNVIIIIAPLPISFDYRYDMLGSEVVR